MLLKTSLFVLACLAAGQAAAQCYTVYDRNNRVLYHDAQSPVDMSGPLTETVQAAFPGGHLVFDNFSACSDLRPLTAPVAMAMTEPDTSRMGAAPNESGTPPQQAQRPQRTITEYKDSRLRVIREGDRITIEQMGKDM
jgi:hypothetical protein